MRGQHHAVPQPEVSAFGQLVRELREKNDLTQVEVARRADLSSGFIAAVETGRRGQRPSRPIVLAIAAALEVHPSELLQAAGLFQRGDDVPVLDRVAQFEAFVRSDPLLERDDKDTLIAMYRRFVPLARRGARGSS